MLNPPLWLSLLVWVSIPPFFDADFVASRRRQRSRPAHPPTGRVAVAATPSRPGVAATVLDLAAAGVLTPPPGGVRVAGPAAAPTQTSTAQPLGGGVCADQSGRGDVDRHPEGRADEVGLGLVSGEQCPPPPLPCRGIAAPGTATAFTRDSPAPRHEEAA